MPVLHWILGKWWMWVWIQWLVLVNIQIKYNRHLCAVCGSQQDVLTGNLLFLSLQFVKLSESICGGSATNFRFCRLFEPANSVKHVNNYDEMTERIFITDDFLSTVMFSNEAMYHLSMIIK
jgi:hypothetical protein